MKEFFYMTRVLHDLGEVGTSEEDGVEKKWLIVPAFKKYIVIHSLILATHWIIASHVAAILLGASGRRVKLSSLPYRSFHSSDPNVWPFQHSQLSCVPHLGDISESQTFFEFFRTFPQLTLSLRFLTLLLISVINHVAAFHTPHVLSHNKPIIASVSIL